MSFVIYLIGFAIFIGGVAWALITAGVTPLYVVIASVILLGIEHHDGGIAYARRSLTITFHSTALLLALHAAASRRHCFV